MAARFPDPPSPIDPIEGRINYFCDKVIMCVNTRRAALLATAREMRNVKIERRRRRIEGSQQLEATKEEIEGNMRENILKETQETLLREVERKLEEVRTPLPETCVVFRGDYGHMEQLITALGEVREEELPAVPRYEAMKPVVAVGKRGKAPGKLWTPQAVAIDSNTNNIYVTEGDVLSVFSRISIFSEGGKFLKSYTHEQMRIPYGIAIHRNSLYVTDTGFHAVLLFRIESEIRFVAKFGLYIEGTESGDFYYPFDLAVSADGDVYVADRENNMIQILDSSLRYLKPLTEQSIQDPRDIKLTADSVYVLCGDSPCIRVFSYTGDMLRSLITRGDLLQVSDARHFCLDAQDNILISDYGSKKIKVFSKEGTLIHTLGERRDEVGMFDLLQGIAIRKEMNLIVVSWNKKYSLQMFSSL